MKKLFQRAFLGAGLLIVWQAACLSGLWSRYLLPPPAAVGRALLQMLYSGELVGHIAVSFQRVFLGYTVAVVFGVALGVGAVSAPALYRFFAPLISFFRAIPPLGLTPLLILWLGIGEGTKIVLIFLSAFFPVFSATVSGMESCDRKLIEAGESFGFGQLQILRHIILPSALPTVTEGMCLGLGYAWRAIIGAEMIAAASGLGFCILDAQAMARPDKMIAGVFVIGILGMGLDRLLRLLKTRFGFGGSAV